MRGKHYTLESYFNYQRRTMNCVISFRFIKRQKCAIFFTDCAVTGSALYGQFYCFCTHTCHMRVAFAVRSRCPGMHLVPCRFVDTCLLCVFFGDSQVFALTFRISLLPFLEDLNRRPVARNRLFIVAIYYVTSAKCND